MSSSITSSAILRYKHGTFNSVSDMLAIEEPLEISIAFVENAVLKFKIISVTMRTPGNDNLLAIGFLFTENIITTDTTISKIESKGANKICVFIDGQFVLHLKNTERNFYTTSSCGVCGKASIEAIHTISKLAIYPQNIQVTKEVILNLKQTLNKNQSAFESTGGIHAAALFNIEGKPLYIYEDVGRHNALDKLIGTAYQQNTIPLQQEILLLSGRASFELIQKAAMANIAIVCAIGAPSSLAVQLAEDMDITLIGFLKENSFNVYNGSHRISI